jgi:hypothetical protein
LRSFHNPHVTHCYLFLFQVRQHITDGGFEEFQPGYISALPPTLAAAVQVTRRQPPRGAGVGFLLYSPPRDLPRPPKRHAVSSGGSGGGRESVSGGGGGSKLWPPGFSVFGLVAQASVGVSAMALKLKDAEAVSAELEAKVRELLAQLRRTSGGASQL